MKRHIKEMSDLDAIAWQFLEEKGIQHFCRLYFKPLIKCDSVDNNMGEILMGSLWMLDTFLLFPC